MILQSLTIISIFSTYFTYLYIFNLNNYRYKSFDIVQIFSKPWYGKIGYITKQNEDFSYNVKITKSLNSNKGQIPKSTINKLENEIFLY